MMSAGDAIRLSPSIGWRRRDIYHFIADYGMRRFRYGSADDMREARRPLPECH